MKFEDLANAFAVVEREEVRVIELKINRKQRQALVIDARPHGYDFSDKMLWGAKIKIDNSLKNPVIIGEDDRRAILVNGKWVLRYKSKKLGGIKKFQLMQKTTKVDFDKLERNEQVSEMKKALTAILMEDPELFVTQFVDLFCTATNKDSFYKEKRL